MSKPSPSKRRKWFPVVLGVIGVLLLTLVITVLAGKNAVARAGFEAKLDAISGLEGEVGEADIRLLDRTLVFTDVVLDHDPPDGDLPDDAAPLITVERLEVEVHGPLWQLDSTATVRMTGVVATLVRDPDTEAPLRGLDETAQQQLQDLAVWETDAIHIDEGLIHYIDLPSGVELDAGFEGEVVDLAAAQDPDQRAPMRFAVNAVMSGATFELEGHTQVEVPRPDFAIQSALIGMPLAELSPIAEREADIKIHDGYLALQLDFEGEDGRMNGYVQPHIARLDLEGDDDLASHLRAFGGEVTAKAIDDPAFGRSHRIQLTGSYGEGRRMQLEPVDERNTWLQNRLMKEF